MDVDVGLLYHLRTHAVLSLEGMGCNLIKLAPSPSFAFPRLQIARKTQRRDLGACVSQKKMKVENSMKSASLRPAAANDPCTKRVLYGSRKKVWRGSKREKKTSKGRPLEVLLLLLPHQAFWPLIVLWGRRGREGGGGEKRQKRNRTYFENNNAARRPLRKAACLRRSGWGEERKISVEEVKK